MELIELESDMDIKRGYSENKLVNFYKRYVHEKYPKFVISCQKNNFPLW